jgi:hypothetical protein
MKKLLFAFMTITLFACSSEDNAPVDPNIGNPENPAGVCTDVYVGNAVLTTQAEVDAFAGNHYCGIKGNLQIGSPDSETDITNLENLESLKKIDGKVTVQNNTGLLNLQGLNNIEEITWDLEITQNNALVNLNGLDALKTLGSGDYVGDFTIWKNNALINLEGVGPVNKMARIYVTSNASLQNLKGLENLEQAYSLNIASNNVITTLEGLENLSLLLQNLGIEENAQLASLEALHSLSSVKLLHIAFCGSLINLKGLEGVNAVDILDIQFNYALLNLEGLQNITSFSRLYIYNNPVLTSISHLSGLTTHIQDNINRDIWIYYNFALPSLDGMENITSFSGHIVVQHNNVMTDLCAIRNMVTSGGNSVSLATGSNLYNPTQSQIVSGNCSQ